ncbi:2-keto-3-deoxygluconate kinase [Tetragenococcus halophilus subsp. flandriensis]|uniref:sugar kinase n=1 Tax=Tetragenococcus halophilus TaxID=51669 RepID=UPI0023E9259B|nr:sugar kinase [Tetragenococcus halophilus]GMA09339.1 2-keto-3-deoxygluconate kinase [Tetragenococcus halophilus subsp. flandriensis]
MGKFLTIGEPLYGIASLEEDVSLEHVKLFKRYLAGAEINCAKGMARLGFEVGYISRLGNDIFARYVEQELSEENISTDYISYSETENTAFQLKSKVSKGNPRFGYLRKKSAGSNFKLEFLDKIDYTDVTLIHLTGVFVSLSQNNYNSARYLMKTGRQHGSLITFDPNLRPQLWENEEKMIYNINRLASDSDIVLPGLKEGQILTGEETAEGVADFYLYQGVDTVIVKLGPEGAYIKNKNVNGKIPGFIVDDVIDTVGAGDGFAVGVLSGIMKQTDWITSAIRGAAIGALAVTVPGDNEGYPTEEILESFIANNERYE